MPSTSDPAAAGAGHVSGDPADRVGPTQWQLPNPRKTDEHGVAAVGADLEPSTLVAAYRSGLFPMRLGGRSGPLGWWSPDPRGVMPIDGVHVSRSLRRSRRSMRVTINESFEEVMRSCGDEARPHGWIDDVFVDAYVELHRLSIAHSIEVRDEDGALIGGLYGVRIARFFAGESMFHRVTDASKVALWAACELFALDGVTLFDVQWNTDHLESMGAQTISRAKYLKALAEAVRPIAK